MTNLAALFTGVNVVHRARAAGLFEEAAILLGDADRGGVAVVRQATPTTQRLPVHVVPVRGVMRPGRSALWDRIGWTTYGGLADEIAEADADETVQVTLLDLNTPGGSATGIEEVTEAIAESKTPVHAWCGGWAMSGGYWIASQCRELCGTAWSEYGSIGVASHASFPKVPAGFDGWQDAIVTSSNAPNKIPDPHTPQGLAAIRAEIDEIEARFIGAVAAGRKRTAEDVAANFGQGGVFIAAEARRRGMIDRIVRLDDYVAELSGRKGAGARKALAAEFGRD